MRLLGGALLALGGLTLGLKAAGRVSARAAALETWQAALALAGRELAFRLPSTPELLELLARESGPPARETFAAALSGLERLGEEPFEIIWSGALSGTAGPLEREDLALLDALGTLLGRYGWEDQRRGAEELREALGERSRALREQLSRTGRTYGVVGLSLGLFAALLLI